MQFFSLCYVQTCCLCSVQIFRLCYVRICYITARPVGRASRCFGWLGPGNVVDLGLSAAVVVVY